MVEQAQALPPQARQLAEEVVSERDENAEATAEGQSCFEEDQEQLTPRDASGMLSSFFLFVFNPLQAGSAIRGSTRIIFRKLRSVLEDSELDQTFLSLCRLGGADDYENDLRQSRARAGERGD